MAGTAARLDQAIAALEQLGPDAVLLDTARLEALAAARAIKDSFPEIHVIALGVLEKRSSIIAYAEAGIAGYVCRESSLDDLVRTVESAASGELRCSPRIAAALLHRVSRLAALVTDPGDRHLTLREIEVVELIDKGLTNKEIAARLHIEVATAKNHVHNILDKMQVHHRGQAAARARRVGLLGRTTV